MLGMNDESPLTFEDLPGDGTTHTRVFVDIVPADIATIAKQWGNEVDVVLDVASGLIHSVTEREPMKET